MQTYRTKSGILKGTNLNDVRKKAMFIFKQIKKKSKRQPYVRSAYFKKDKIFLALFWEHLYEKHSGDRFRRLQYFSAAIELIESSRHAPTSKVNPNNLGECLHRFKGSVRGHDDFYVQIKEDLGSHKKYLISIFPDE